MSAQPSIRKAKAKAPAPSAPAVLTRATVRAADLLQLPQARLAAVLGLSAATVSRMASGSYEVDTARTDGQLAALFVRVFRSLDSLVGANDQAAQAWLNSQNLALGGVPADMMTTIEGLVRVVHYLDAVRGRI